MDWAGKSAKIRRGETGVSRHQGGTIGVIMGAKLLEHHSTMVLEGLRGDPLCRETLVSRTADVRFCSLAWQTILATGNYRHAGTLRAKTFLFQLVNAICVH